MAGDDKKHKAKHIRLLNFFAGGYSPHRSSRGKGHHRPHVEEERGRAPRRVEEEDEEEPGRPPRVDANQQSAHRTRHRHRPGQDGGEEGEPPHIRVNRHDIPPVQEPAPDVEERGRGPFVDEVNQSSRRRRHHRDDDDGGGGDEPRVRVRRYNVVQEPEGTPHVREADESPRRRHRQGRHHRDDDEPHIRVTRYNVVQEPGRGPHVEAAARPSYVEEVPGRSAPHVEAPDSNNTPYHAEGGGHRSHRRRRATRRYYGQVEDPEIEVPRHNIVQEEEPGDIEPPANHPSRTQQHSRSRHHQHQHQHHHHHHYHEHHHSFSPPQSPGDFAYPVRAATEADRRQHGIPAHLSLAHWDGTEPPIYLHDGSPWDSQALAHRLYDDALAAASAPPRPPATFPPPPPPLPMHVYSRMRSFWLPLVMLHGYVAILRENLATLRQNLAEDDEEDEELQTIEGCLGGGDRLRERFQGIIRTCDMLVAEDRARRGRFRRDSRFADLVEELFRRDDVADFELSVAAWGRRAQEECSDILVRHGLRPLPVVPELPDL